ncbi:hypothetical protein [Amycolatopsis methanolica]|uniref:hypothetical protein n=1 Tax=Amycolatopsis methanolica TaxID=1814 RepID=UPI001CC24B7E|nr:hypothetical protein [Amycolatopsis methanolica]
MSCRTQWHASGGARGVAGDRGEQSGHVARGGRRGRERVERAGGEDLLGGQGREAAGEVGGVAGADVLGHRGYDVAR